MSGFIYGKGVDFIGPSLIHGLSLVCFGMLFGYGLNPPRIASGVLQMSPRVSLIMAAVCIVIIGVYFNWQSPTRQPTKPDRRRATDKQPSTLFRHRHSWRDLGDLGIHRFE